MENKESNSSENKNGQSADAGAQIDSSTAVNTAQTSA